MKHVLCCFRERACAYSSALCLCTLCFGSAVFRAVLFVFTRFSHTLGKFLLHYIIEASLIKCLLGHSALATLEQACFVVVMFPALLTLPFRCTWSLSSYKRPLEFIFSETCPFSRCIQLSSSCTEFQNS